MTKRIVISLLLVCAVVAGNSQSKKLIRTYGIEKKIETTVKYKDGEEVKKYISETASFDQDGEWVELVDYNSKGEVKSIETRKYEKGLLVEESEDRQIAKSEGKVFYERHAYIYEKGNVVAKETYDKDEVLVKRIVYTYNSFDDVETETKFSSDGSVQKLVLYHYDDKGFRTEKHEKDAAGNLLETKLYAYE